MATKKAETVPEVLEFDTAGWQPQTGDVVSGTVKDLTTGESEFGRYPIVVLSQKDGTEVAVHAFHYTLKNRLVEMRPEVGHTLTIACLGETVQTDKEGNPKMFAGEPKTLYRYDVQSPEFSFNWDRF